MKIIKKPLVKGIALILGLVTGNSLAEDTASSFTLEEIVVTATKRAESIQDVPISISAFSRDSYE